MVEILHYFYQGDVKRFLGYLAASFGKPQTRAIDIAFSKLRVPGIKKFARGIFALSMLTGDEVKDALYLLPIALEGGGAANEIIRVAMALNEYQVIAREHRFTVSVLTRNLLLKFSSPFWELHTC